MTTHDYSDKMKSLMDSWGAAHNSCNASLSSYSTPMTNVTYIADADEFAIEFLNEEPKTIVIKPPVDNRSEEEKQICEMILG